MVIGGSIDLVDGHRPRLGDATGEQPLVVFSAGVPEVARPMHLDRQAVEDFVHDSGTRGRHELAFPGAAHDKPSTPLSPVVAGRDLEALALLIKQKIILYFTTNGRRGYLLSRANRRREVPPLPPSAEVDPGLNHREVRLARRLC